MEETQGYVRELSGQVAAGLTSIILRGLPMSTKQRAFINRLTFINLDTAASVGKVYLEGPTESSPLFQLTLTTANWIYQHPLEIWIYPGWRLRVEFSTCTAADNESMHAFGITRFDR